MIDYLYVLIFDILRKDNVAETLMSVGFWPCACFPTSVCCREQIAAEASVILCMRYQVLFAVCVQQILKKYLGYYFSCFSLFRSGRYKSILVFKVSCKTKIYAEILCLNKPYVYIS